MEAKLPQYLVLTTRLHYSPFSKNIQECASEEVFDSHLW